MSYYSFRRHSKNGLRCRMHSMPNGSFPMLLVPSMESVLPSKLLPKVEWNIITTNIFLVLCCGCWLQFDVCWRWVQGSYIRQWNFKDLSSLRYAGMKGIKHPRGGTGKSKFFHQSPVYALGRPFGGATESGSIERLFNERHSLARRVVEMAFGILNV